MTTDEMLAADEGVGVEQASLRKRCSTKTILNAIRSGSLKARKVLGQWRIAVKDLARWYPKKPINQR